MISSETHDSRVGRGGLALIAAFWTLFGAIMFGTLYVSEGLRTGVGPAGLLLFSLGGAYVWALLTPAALRLAEAFSPTGDDGVWRAGRVAGLLAIGLVFAPMISVVIALASHRILEGSFGGVLEGPSGRWVMLRYRLATDVLACQFVLVAGVARDYFLRYRLRLAEAAELRSQLADARLQLLRAQLNPHFLFNTLNAIAALVQTDAKSVRRMIALLSELMRDALYGPSEAEISLEREVSTLKRYLEIMEIRFGGTLHTRMNVDGGIGNALVPPLILQPLVENALKHGVSPGSGNATVEVAVTRQDQQLVLSVRDAGPGPTKWESLNARGPIERDQEGGFGLRHTRERLRQLYGDAAALELRSSPGGGTVAEIRLPYQTTLEPATETASATVNVA